LLFKKWIKMVTDSLQLNEQKKDDRGSFGRRM